MFPAEGSWREWQPLPFRQTRTARGAGSITAAGSEERQRARVRHPGGLLNDVCIAIRQEPRARCHFPPAPVKSGEPRYLRY